MYDSDFQHNLRMREHFLAIKKRHDMRRRAKKFRDKQKREVARLRTIAKKQDNEVQVQDDVTEDKEQVNELESKIIELRKELDAKNQQVMKLREITANGRSPPSDFFSTNDGPTHIQSRKSCDTVTECDEAAEFDQGVGLEMQKSIENVSQVAEFEVEHVDSVSVISDQPNHVQEEQNFEEEIAVVEQEIIEAR